MPHAIPNRSTSLKKAPLFADLCEAEVNFLSTRAITQHYGPGQLIFSEGDPCEGLFVVHSGEVRIFKTSATGREQVLTIEGPGASVAELPVFDGGNYSASASAVTQTQALCFEHPEVGPASRQQCRQHRAT